MSQLLLDVVKTPTFAEKRRMAGERQPSRRNCSDAEQLGQLFYTLATAFKA